MVERVWRHQCTDHGCHDCFRFGELTIQRHDTYLMMNSVRAIIYLTVSPGTVRNLFLLTDFVTGRYKIIALLVAIINPIVALLLIMLVSMEVQAIMGFREIYPDINLLNNWLASQYYQQ